MNFKWSAAAAMSVVVIMSLMASTAATVNAVEDRVRACEEAIVTALQTPAPTEPPAEPQATPARWYHPDVGLDQGIQEYIFQQATEHGVDYELVLSIIIKESACDIKAVSATGDYGLMQINQINHGWLAKKYGLTDMFDPRQNITAGIMILSELAVYDDGTEAGLHKVLMAYNMGPTGASNAWADGTYSTSYSEEIMRIRESLIQNNFDGSV